MSQVDNTPFFIVGCVRSGTTMLRDLLRMHPRLECPEETHFYRWADPFGSPRYDKNYITMKIFQNHRKLDGIADKDFHEARFQARNRREMSEAYGQLYLKAVGNASGRWFDKTPQNIYGLFLLSHQFPDSKFIHIHRHPLNVVSSLVEGRVMAKHSVKGGINYWMEAMILINEYKRAYPGRVYELSYEKISLAPVAELESLFQFIGEDASLLSQQAIHTHPEQNKYLKVLTRDEIELVLDSCQEYLALYGYANDPVQSLAS